MQDLAPKAKLLELLTPLTILVLMIATAMIYDGDQIIKYLPVSITIFSGILIWALVIYLKTNNLFYTESGLIVGNKKTIALNTIVNLEPVSQPVNFLGYRFRHFKLDFLEGDSLSTLSFPGKEKDVVEFADFLKTKNNEIIN